MITEEYARISVPDFLRQHLRHLTLKEVGAIFMALHIACHHLNGLTRRSGGQAIEHAMLVAGKAISCGLSVETVVVAILHDILEDSKRNPSLPEIEEAFEDLGVTVITMLVALTETPKSTKAAYYDQIFEATKTDWEVIFIKLFDRLDGQEWPYDKEDSRDYINRARSYYRETLGPFAKLCAKCRPYIPEDRLEQFDNLVSQIMLLARKHLIKLDTLTVAS